MKRKSNLTPKLRQNWWLDAVLGISAVIATLSSIYFLVYPDGGYQGGRNPYYNIRLIFDRTTWDLLHTWSGLIAIMAALLHIIIHWRWITGTANRTRQVIFGQRKKFGFRLTYNIILDAIIGISFMISAISGVYFMFNSNGGPDAQTILFSRFTWDMLHTWSGAVMIMAAILHFALHWKWIVNITGKLLGKGTHKSLESETSLSSIQEVV